MARDVGQRFLKDAERSRGDRALEPNIAELIVDVGGDAGARTKLAGLPLGWGADRDSPGEPWVRSENPAADDE